MDRWLTSLTEALAMPRWAVNVLVCVVIALIAIRSLVWLYCLVVSVRVAIRERNNDRGERALKVVDKLLRWFPFRR